MISLKACIKHPATVEGGSPGLVVMGDDSRSKGRGFKSRILDGHNIFSHLIIKIVIVCLKRLKINKKRPGLDHF